MPYYYKQAVLHKLCNAGVREIGRARGLRPECSSRASCSNSHTVIRQQTEQASHSAHLFKRLSTTLGARVLAMMVQESNITNKRSHPPKQPRQLGLRRLRPTHHECPPPLSPHHHHTTTQQTDAMHKPLQNGRRAPFQASSARRWQAPHGHHTTDCMAVDASRRNLRDVCRRRGGATFDRSCPPFAIPLGDQLLFDALRMLEELCARAGNR